MAKSEVVWDGRVSIEHQLDIHASDLVQCGANELEVREILSGLQYVMDYRLRGRRQRVLEKTVCDRLVRALLLLTGEKTKRGFFHLERRPSANAEMAFALLADFCVEVNECAQALRELPLDELSVRLCFRKRILRPSDPAIFLAAQALLRVIMTVHDWRDVFFDSEIDAVYDVLDGANFFSEAVPTEREKDMVVVTLYPPPALYFDRDPQRVIDMYHTSIESGLLNVDQLNALRQHYSRNELPTHTEKPVWRMLIEQLSDVMIIILIVSTVVSGVVDYPQIESSLVLGLVVFLNIGVGYWQELKSSRTVAAMRSLQIPTARVRRYGKESEILATEIVPGDIIILGEGDYVPADLRLVQANRLEIKEAILTGEPGGVSKSSKAIRIPSRKLPLGRCRGNAFMGTMVTRGTGVGIAIRTGASTEIGKISAALNQQPTGSSPSPLQIRMTRLGQGLVVMALLLCGTVFVVGILQGENWKVMTRLAVSLAVSVIPEGLVAILTVGMALAVRRLAKHDVLVRRLNAVETLGGISVVAADKTGTLTEGRMRLEKLWVFDCPHNYKDENLQTAEREISKVCLTIALEACILCNNSTPNGTGEPTEVALMEGAQARGLDTSKVALEWSRLLEVPFDSERRMMSVLVAAKHDEQFGTIFSKGATEVILQKCTTVMMDGDLVPLTIDLSNHIFTKENEYSDLGLRVLALAVREKVKITEFMTFESSLDYPAGPLVESDVKRAEWIEKDLAFIGLVCLVDPIRIGVAESILTFQRAGIKVCMITGDHIRTATAVASQLSIYSMTDPERSRVIKGRDLDLLNLEALASLRPFPSVFARVSPVNKLEIVKALKIRGERVAMTGDGVNDAPAIRQADVGVAMGLGGTQITRDAASIILLKDNFVNMVQAIIEGRQIYRNVGLFIIYLLSCNSAEIWTVLGAMLAGWSPPLSPINILWANVIADIPPSLCLSLECDDPSGDLMTDRPSQVSPAVMGKVTWILIAFNGAILSSLTLVVYGTCSKRMSLEEQRSEAFLVLIGLQILLALFSRSPRRSVLQIGLFGNLWLFGAVAFSIVLLLAGLYLPFLYQLLDLKPVGLLAWAKFAVATIILISSNELVKFFIRRLKL